jgi:hypothetical protein
MPSFVLTKSLADIFSGTADKLHTTADISSATADIMLTMADISYSRSI